MPRPLPRETPVWVRRRQRRKLHAAPTAKNMTSAPVPKEMFVVVVVVVVIVIVIIFVVSVADIKLHYIIFRRSVCDPQMRANFVY